jgi:hypothetical protein
MKKQALAVGTAAALAALSVAGSAVAAQAHQSRPAATFKTFRVTLSSTRPHSGQSITASGTSTEKNASFNCIEILLHGSQTPGQQNAWLPTLRTPSSNAKGRVVCKDVFQKFHHTLSGKTHYCPPSNADKRAGWGCGMVIASNDRKSIGIAHFKF